MSEQKYYTEKPVTHAVVEHTHEAPTETLDFLSATWPIFVGFITLVVVLAKMHATIETQGEKIKVAFDLINNLSHRKD